MPTKVQKTRKEKTTEAYFNNKEMLIKQTEIFFCAVELNKSAFNSVVIHHLTYRDPVS